MPSRPFPFGATLLAVAALVGTAQPGLAFLPTLPETAVMTGSHAELLGSYALPLGPWSGGDLPVRRIEGPLSQTAWRVAAPGITTLQLLAPLRAQLEAEGFRTVFECDTGACGGFDFRYATDVLPEPDMHVDLGDFRFLSATRTGPDGEEAVSLMVSRTSANGFVQVVHVGGPPPPPTTIASSGTPEPRVVAVAPAVPGPAALAPSGMAAALEQGASVPLEDLSFESGSATLGSGSYASLGALAEFLRSRPAAKVMLVGHTDASGNLPGNIALSRARAASVRDRLIDSLGVPPGQIDAEGAGFLSPRASNFTEEGRARNRRVEVMLMTSTQ